MVGRVQRIASNRLFDFGGLAFDDGETVVVERKLSVEGANEATLAIALHELDVTGLARIAISVEAVAPDTDEPQTDFVGRTVASVGLDSSSAAGTLRLDSFSAPWGKWVRIIVSASHAAPPVPFRCRLTIELVVKAPPEERADCPLVERQVDECFGSLVLRPCAYPEAACEGYEVLRLTPATRGPIRLPTELEPILDDFADAVRTAECRQRECVEPEPWNEIKHIEQVVMRLDAVALSDGRPLVYDDDLGLEPAILVRTRPSGDVLCVWNRTTLAGVERPGGVLMPAVPQARFDDLGEWIERIGGPPHPTALLANPVRAAPDSAVVAGWATGLGDRLVAKRALPHDVLEQYLHRLAARCFRPRSIVARAASLGTVYLVVAEATALPWRWLRDLDRRTLASVLQGAASRRETAICVFSEGLTRKTYGCVLETSPSRRPLASVVEFSLDEAELEWTLRNYACAGYRLLALFDEPEGLTACWSRTLERDTRFTPILESVDGPS